ncbi:chemotaxis protein CheA [Desulfococcaceae bacterium HSG8]|nr:chemotaxis protein CheA [Desulfococcaceae bacterium HSG8]
MRCRTEILRHSLEKRSAEDIILKTDRFSQRSIEIFIPLCYLNKNLLLKLTERVKTGQETIMMDFDESILEEFVIESQEHFENIEDDILQLSGQKDSAYQQLIDKIFRAIHSVKGASGFLNLRNIGQLSHVMETLLSAIRTDKIKPETDVVNALLAGVDRLSTMLADVNASNQVNISDIHDRLAALLLEGSGSEEIQDDLKVGIRLRDRDGEEIGFEISRHTLKNLPSSHGFLYVLRYDLSELSGKTGKSPVKLVGELMGIGEIIDSRLEVCSDDLTQGVPEGPLLYDVLYSTPLEPKAIYETLGMSKHKVIFVDKEILIKMADEPSEKFLPIPGDGKNSEDGRKTEGQFYREKKTYAEPGEKKTHGNSESPERVEIHADRKDIRVDLEKLDILINLVGELVIAESMVTNNPDLAGFELENFESSARNLRRIISDLQDVAMSMRMIPLSRTFKRMIRLVHVLSDKVGKKIELKLIGEETEVDKTVIEHITDPLLHIVRNSIDHGIEPPEGRKTAGKPENGTIIIEAKHEGGEVLISVSDDGQGIDREKIIAEGIEMGLLGDDAKTFDDQRIFGLIFEPGFSTNKKVTEVSGRGVGLDVVKRNLDKLKGRADIRSILGNGVSIVLRIPLTLAIIDGMIVRVGSASYTIPLLSIRESFRPDPDQVTVTMEGQEIVRIREDLIPVIRLHELYHISSDQRELDRGILINVSAGTKTVCLFADEIIGHHHTVVKGIPNYVASARGISGCTILGNGEISLILDVGNIIDIAENRK